MNIPNFNIKNVAEEIKLSNESIQFKTFSSVKKTVNVTPVKDRKAAFELLKSRYMEISRTDRKRAMSLTVHSKDSFAKLRNYEIENALQDVGLIAYRIETPCPYNGFSFFS
jgi:hypothetical protein